MIGAMATSFQMVYARTVVFGVPDPTVAMLTHASPGDSWTLTGKSASVSFEGHCSVLLVPSVHKVLFVPSKSLFHQSHGSSIVKPHWPSKSNSLRVLSPFAGSPCWEICCGP